MIVLKFGGTSVEDAAAMRRLAGIVTDRTREQPVVVVVSALSGITDRLTEMAAAAWQGHLSSANTALAAARERHLRVLAELTAGAPPEGAAVAAEIEEQCRSLGELLRGVAAVGELTPRSRDAVLSFGERISPLLVSLALRRADQPAVATDARRIVVTDEQFTQAQPLIAELTARAEQELRPLLAMGSIPVLGGFIGATQRGVGTTLGRGGSDFSAALLGAALGAERIEIWTDVDGMLTADPRLCPRARRIERLSFAEAAESAYFGAKVLHPATLLPAMESDIPVWVLNSRRPRPGPPDARYCGTLITARREAGRERPGRAGVCCISTKRRVALIDLVSTRMLQADGFMRAIFEVFAEHRVAVDMIATSEVSVSLTVPDTDRLPALADALGRFAAVRFEGRKALLCLVGEGMRNTPGVAAAVFTALGDINVRMISQGASEVNIGFVIEDDDVPRAVARLHERFFGDDKSGNS